MTEIDADVLKKIEARPNIPTYVIRNIMAHEEGYGIGLSTADVLRSCKRLEASGKIRQAGMSSNSICWSVAT